MAGILRRHAPRTPRTLLAIVLLALSIVLTAVALVIVVATDAGAVGSDDANGVVDALGAVALLGFPIIGALIVMRKPEHRIGWLYLGIGAGIALYFLTDSWATYTLIAEPGALPAGKAVVWIANWLGPAVIYIALTWPLLLFPTGNLPSPRWRWAFGISVASIAVMTLGFAFTPGELASYETVENPLALPASAGATIEVVAGIASIVATISVVVAAIAAIVRLRHARGIERQQLKWFVWSAGIVALAIVGALAIGIAYDAYWWAGAMIVGSLLAMIGATGIAILRYQLYDIDIIINRTLVYGALTLLLAGLYALGVVVFQQVLAGFASGSDLAVAGTTLAVAALVRPGRSRIQQFVDRRFYRHKYDAEQTIDTFSDRLRDELDLDALITEMRLVVHETMQPEFVTVWLRERE